MNGAAVRRSVALLTVLFLTGASGRLCAQQDSLPVGYGSLRRDDIAVHLTTPELDIQVLPLREGVIRLLAPDTYRSLTALIGTRAAAIDSAARQAGVQHPLLVLVTFAGLVPGVRFTPENVNLASRGQLFRALGVVPLSPRWNSYQLGAREQAMAIYLFDEDIRVSENLTVSYGNDASDAWSRSVRLLEQERARVAARASAASK